MTSSILHEKVVVRSTASVTNEKVAVGILVSLLVRAICVLTIQVIVCIVFGEHRIKLHGLL